MKKDRFGRYLPIMTAVTAFAFTPNLSNARAATDKAEAAVSTSAKKYDTTATEVATTSESQDASASEIPKPVLDDKE